MRVWLANIREKESMTQEKVAKLTGCDVSTINKIELGIRRPSVEKAKKIAIALNFERYGKDWTSFYQDGEKRAI